jgi:uncharacterized integral membrane protein
MTKSILAVATTIVIVVFAISNSHHVDLNLAVGKLEIRLIFLLLVAFLIGMTVPVFYRLFRSAEEKRQKKREAELQQVIERIDHDIAA